MNYRICHPRCAILAVAERLGRVDDPRAWAREMRRLSVLLEMEAEAASLPFEDDFPYWGDCRLVQTGGGV